VCDGLPAQETLNSQWWNVSSPDLHVTQRDASNSNLTRLCKVIQHWTAREMEYPGERALPLKFLAYFVLWEAVFQTNCCTSLKVKVLGPQKVTGWLRYWVPTSCLGSWSVIMRSHSPPFSSLCRVPSSWPTSASGCNVCVPFTARQRNLYRFAEVCSKQWVIRWFPSMLHNWLKTFFTIVLALIEQ